jgi:XTP/dITP diphosphohydrolase
MPTLVLASGNKGKLAELSAMLEPLGFDVKPQSNFEVEDAEETGLSFIENAILKARHAAKATGMAALADDSGIAVPALGGAPGIYSARYAGEHGNDGGNIDLLLKNLKGESNRAAFFYCAIAYISHAEDPTPLIATGAWHGEILQARQGEGGFGYDPVFFDAELKRSAAELSREEKATRSHRGQALRALVQQLNERA